MIVLHVDLEPGFRKADINSLPAMRSDTILRFVETIGEGEEKNEINEALRSQDQKIDKHIDYVQVRKAAGVHEVRAVVLPASGSSEYAVVAIKVDDNKDEIIETTCEQCPQKVSCTHILAVIFWLHRKSVDTESPAIGEFWGTETESATLEEDVEAIRIRDIFPADELRLEGDTEASSVTEIDGHAFLEAMLDEMNSTDMRDSIFYRHCRPATDEFESVFVHHTMLAASNNCIKDMRSFNQHMEDQAKGGLFDNIAEVTRRSYKTPLWLEVQYMRIRCSIIHRIASRKDASDDEAIIAAISGNKRECNIEERQQLKQHKRFILKQTEKLENKLYNECGLLLSESYPYICASPDGITDDHIVEIKAPKTEDEFEKYLEGRETIAPKYMAQIQIQMYMANVTKALYCVLSPTFDANGALHYVWVQADMEYVASLLGAAEDFWRDVIFPRLSKIYLDLN